jgi:5,10-methylenetetrahydromethanopterin reductase
MSEVLPRIGIRLSSGDGPRRCIDLARAAEASGFASIWFAENPFESGVFTAAGACAAATKRVRIGIGVVNPYTRHPVQIAMEFAALDSLSEGRAILGIGFGIASRVSRFGIDIGRPVTAVRDAIAIIRPMLAGGRVTYDGVVFNVRNALILNRLFPTPPHGGPPIYMSAAGEPMLRACGAIADGLIVSNLTPLRSTKRMIEIVADAAAKAGRPRPAIVQYVPCVARPESEEARQTARSAIGRMLLSFWPAEDDWPQAKERIVAESGIPRRDFVAALDRLRHREDGVAALDDRFVTAFAIAGTAAECLAQAAQYRQAGVDELALTIAGSRPLIDLPYLGAALAAA